MIELPELPPDERLRAIWIADWIELELLFGSSRTVSLLDVADVLRDDPAPVFSDPALLGEEVPDEPSSFLGDDWEWAESLATGAFGELKERAAWLGERYPILVESDIASTNEATDAQNVYRFLASVRARHLYRVVRDLPEPGQAFEELVTCALARYGPFQAVRFGPGANGQRGNGLPAGLWDAVVALAGEMHEAPSAVPDGGNGDYKVDAIAWRPFDDGRPGQVVILCQATISESEWQQKVPAKKWLDGRLIDFLAPPVPAVAFPESLSLTSPEVLRGLNFPAIPLDRLRLLSLVSDATVPAELAERIDAWVTTVRDRIPA